MNPGPAGMRESLRRSEIGLPTAFLIGAVRLYRATLSGWLGGQCRFYPSCSVYAEETLVANGAVRGSAMAIWRVLRCNPFSAGGVEHAISSLKYEHVIHDADDPPASSNSGTSS